MEELKFYRVRNELINYYRKIDSKVLLNYGGTRAYIGVLLEISKFKYIIPLSSPKENDYNPLTGELKKSTFTILRLEDFETLEEKVEYAKSIISLTPEEKLKDHIERKSLGKIFLSNMIPVMDEDIEYIDIKFEEKKYGNLLNKQYNQIKKLHKRLVINSKVIYQNKIAPVPNSKLGYLNSCCDFTRLEISRANFKY